MITFYLFVQNKNSKFVFFSGIFSLPFRAVAQTSLQGGWPGDAGATSSSRHARNFWVARAVSSGESFLDMTTKKQKIFITPF
jgi:hypothetical protein